VAHSILKTEAVGSPEKLLISTECGEVTFQEKELLIKGQVSIKIEKNKEKESATTRSGEIKSIETSRITKSNFDLRNPINIIYMCTSGPHLQSLESKETYFCSSLKMAGGFACGRRTGSSTSLLPKHTFGHDPWIFLLKKEDSM
jgi:hypothetical protein